jgi:hypothetical protein
VFKILCQGLEEATHALKLLEVASGRACAAWAGSCAFWAQTTVVIILMEMKQFSMALLHKPCLLFAAGLFCVVSGPI